ncbi:hypothetical protein LZ32DRAFT_613621 [Colletotrichum eremochloae]|nr:hypothetical protein LZ32DRAFT_613621 [Colletotrichum eremochloae]
MYGIQYHWASIVVWINRWGMILTTSLRPGHLGSLTQPFTSRDSAKPGAIPYRSSGVGVDIPNSSPMQIKDNAMAPYTRANGDVDSLFGQALVGWKSHPPKALQALSNATYDKAEVFFIDNNF